MIRSRFDRRWKRWLGIGGALGLSLLPVARLAAQTPMTLDRDHFCSWGEDLALPEALYVFPPDEETAAAVSRILAQAGLKANFEVIAANVPSAAAVLQGNRRLVLYNQLFLRDIVRKTGTDWAAMSILAHELGHHLNLHTLGNGGSRDEQELAADKFSGDILSKLGATLDQARAALAARPETNSSTYPPKSVRLAAIGLGWINAQEIAEKRSAPPEAIARQEALWAQKKEEQKSRQREEREEREAREERARQREEREERARQREETPPLPVWPPPRASANMEIPRELLAGFKERPKLVDISRRLVQALNRAGYAEYSYYAVPRGFALVSRIEQIDSAGRPLPGDSRWPLRGRMARSPVFSLASYLRALFSSPPGLYRVLVFVVTDRPFIQQPMKRERSSPARWVWDGANRLSAAVGRVDYSPEYSCTALVYELIREAGLESASVVLPGNLPGRIHLERAQLLSALQRRGRNP